MKTEIGRGPAPVNRTNSANFRESRESELWEREPLAEFELLFVDFQGLDAGLEGRWWNSKLSRCSGRAGKAALRWETHSADRGDPGGRFHLLRRRSSRDSWQR